MINGCGSQAQMDYISLIGVNMNKFLTLTFLLIFVACSNKINSDYYINTNESNYWTNDLKEIEIVMSYILEYKDYKIMSKLSYEDKLEYIDNFFISIDPDSTTKNNEYLLKRKRILFFLKYLIIFLTSSLFKIDVFVLAFISRYDAAFRISFEVLFIFFASSKTFIQQKNINKFV